MILNDDSKDDTLWRMTQIFPTSWLIISALLIIRCFKNIFADDGRDKCFNVGCSNEDKYDAAIFF